MVSGVKEYLKIYYLSQPFEVLLLPQYFRIFRKIILAFAHKLANTSNSLFSRGVHQPLFFNLDGYAHQFVGKLNNFARARIITNNNNILQINTAVQTHITGPFFW